MSCNIVDNFRHFIRQIKVPEEGCKGETGTVRSAGAELQTNNCFPLLATGGSPGVIQRRNVGRRNDEMPKDFFCYASSFILYILCIPVKS